LPKKIITRFKDTIKNSGQYLRDLSADGHKIVGYFCTYTPVELIHSAGFIPVRITGGYGSLDKALLYVPDFICPYMKRSLEKALQGHYDFLSGLVQGYTCDAACGMVNIWKDTTDFDFFHSVPIPYNDTIESREYFKAVLLELIEKLESSGGTFSESRLNASLEVYKNIRKYQYDLYKLRYKQKLSLSAADLMSAIDAGAIIPPEKYLEMIKELLPLVRKNTVMKNDRCPVLISGSLIERPEMMSMIEHIGGSIVADDLCNGMRQLVPIDGKGDSPVDRMIDRYAKRFPCPSRSRASDRALYILDLVNQSGALGVIFLLQKFCTPHLSDVPMLSEQLKLKGIPSILVEMDESWQIEGQPKTRIEGFIEMLKQ
jgi:bcr-type benzoyl-CoA reductase subunit C